MLGNRTGASIIELVVAMTVITVGLVAVSGMMTLNMRQAALAEFRADQMAVRTYTTERMRGLPYDSVAMGSISIGGIDANWTIDEQADSKIVTLVTGGVLPSVGYAYHDADTSEFTVWAP